MSKPHIERRFSAYRPLRIAMVGEPWYDVPPSGYGGIELIVAGLVNGLAKRGHDVTLYGAGSGTGTAGRFVSTTEELQYPKLGQSMPEALHVARVNRMLARETFDVVHDHTLAGPLSAGHRRAPTVVTVHGAPRGEYGDYLAALGDSVKLVAISRAQRALRPELNWSATIHHGVSVDDRAIGRDPAGPVLWLARFHPDKGPDLAVHACRAAGLPIVLAGKINEPDEQRYFDEHVKPLLDDDVSVVVNADRPAVRRLLASARCLIMPVRWPEPFGMVMIEAMAAGLPVVGMRRGSVPEIVEHGVTGFVCDDVPDMAQALLRTDELDSLACVQRVVAHFSAELMVRKYEQIYLGAARAGAAKRALTGSHLAEASAPLSAPGYALSANGSAVGVGTVGSAPTVTGRPNGADRLTTPRNPAPTTRPGA